MPCQTVLSWSLCGHVKMLYTITVNGKVSGVVLPNDG